MAYLASLFPKETRGPEPILTVYFSCFKVGGYAVGYKNLSFVTIRGAGHFVPSYQPARALAFFSSFLAGKLPSADEP